MPAKVNPIYVPRVARLQLLGSLDVLLGVPITVTLVSVAVVTEWLSNHLYMIGTLARGPLGVVAGTRPPYRILSIGLVAAHSYATLTVACMCSMF